MPLLQEPIRPEWRSSAVNGSLLTIQQLETTDGQKVIEFRDPSGNIVGWTDTAGNVFIDGAYSIDTHTTTELNALGVIIGADHYALAFNSTTGTWQSWDGAAWSNLSASSGAAIVSGDANAVVFMNGAGSAFDTDSTMTFGVGYTGTDDTGLLVHKSGSTLGIMRGLHVRTDHTSPKDSGSASTALWADAHANASTPLNHIVGAEAYANQDGTGTLGSLYAFNGYLYNTGSGVISNAYGLNINSQLTGARVTTAYGVFVGDMAASATHPYPFFSGTGRVHHGDTVEATKFIAGTGTDLASDGGSVVQAQGADSSGIGQVNVRATDAYTTQKGGKITFGGPYTNIPNYATYGQWGGENESGAGTTYVGDLVGKAQQGVAGTLTEVVRYKGSDLGAYHIGNVYAPRVVGGTTSSDNNSFVEAYGAPATGYGSFNARDPTSLAADTGGSISFQSQLTTGPTWTTNALVEGKKTNSTSGDSKGYYRVKTNNGTTLTEALRITDTQTVGIGVTSPLQKLQVAGSIGLNNDAGSTALNNAFFVFSRGRHGRDELRDEQLRADDHEERDGDEPRRADRIGAAGDLDPSSQHGGLLHPLAHGRRGPDLPGGLHAGTHRAGRYRQRRHPDALSPLHPRSERIVRPENRRGERPLLQARERRGSSSPTALPRT
jgi:hypothetical protein